MHDNDLSHNDCATSVTGTQSLLEQMYQIINEKILVEEPFFWGHEPIIRDTLTGRLRLILNRSRTFGLWGSVWGLLCWDRFDQVACTADGTYLPAKGAQPGRETGNGSAYRANGERAHLSHLLIRLVERQREQAREQDLVEAILGIGLLQWHQDAHAVGGKTLLFHHRWLAVRSMGEEGGRALGKIENEFLFGRKQTFEGQVY